MGAFERLKELERKSKRAPTEEEKFLGAARIGGGLGLEETKRSIRRRKKEEAPDAPVIPPPGVTVNVKLGGAGETELPRIVRRALEILGKKPAKTKQQQEIENAEEVRRMIDGSQ